MKMWVYVVRRVALLVPVIIGVMTILFIIVSALPIPERLQSVVPFSKYGYSQYLPCKQIGINQPGNCVNPVWTYGTHLLNLDKPVPIQYAYYIYNSLTFNWGTTNTGSEALALFPQVRNTPVATALADFLPYTIELAFLSLAMILVLAIPLGNYSAVYRNRPIDQGSRIFSFSLYALPTFLLGSLVLLGGLAAVGGVYAICGSNATSYTIFTGSWPDPHCFAGSTYPSWMANGLVTHPTGFPTVDALIAAIQTGNSQDWSLAWQSFYRMLLPAAVIALGSVAVILRYVRNSMLEVMNLDFVRTARSKGVPESTVIRKHAGRNSLNVTVTILGLTFAFFIGGFPIVEYVFGLNGVGRILAFSLQQPLDYGLIFGSTLLFTIIVVVANIIVDVLYAYLDPRVRLG